MDPLTHMSLGACMAMAVSVKPKMRIAGLAGALAGLLPDADVFIRSAGDPLLAIEYHRHFTHSFAFQPLTAALALGLALGLRRVVRGGGKFRPSYWAILLAASTHPFCDWWTSYGTRVAWPFSQARLSLDWVSVIDPLVTLPLVLLGVLGVWKRARFLPTAALVLVSLYLGGATVQKERALNAIQAQLDQQGVVPERLAVRPSFGNIVVWRAVWESEGRIHSGMIRVGQEVEWRPGNSAEVIRYEGVAAWEESAPPGTVLRKDLERFKHFSDGWLIRHPAHPDVIGDARYAMLPNSMEPLWGIRVPADRSDEHVKFENFRVNPKESFGKLWGWVQAPLASDSMLP